MPRNAKQIKNDAERSYPVRIRLSADHGFGNDLSKIYNWLDDNCGADSWTHASDDERGVGNEATSFYFRNATIAAGFVARWCAVAEAPLGESRFKLRLNAPKRRDELPNYGWK
jgi:hypothetical protein